MLKRDLSHELFSREPQSSLPSRLEDTSRPVELTPLRSPTVTRKSRPIKDVIKGSNRGM